MNLKMVNETDRGSLPIYFLGIGAYKSATSWLHLCLEQHPNVFVPKEKEIDYFSYNYSKGSLWYKSIFEKSVNKVMGEISPSYFVTPEAPKRIFNWNPNIRLLLLLRNPIERAYSHYCMDLRMGKTREPIDKEILPFIKQGFYYNYLQNYLKYFSREQMLLLIYDDLKENPRNFIKDVFTFLEVDASFEPTIVNELYHQRKPRPKFGSIYQIMYIISRKMANNRRLGAEFLQFAKNHGFVRYLHNVFPNQKYPTLSPEKRREFINAYVEDVSRLSEWMGRDLSFWLCEKN